MTFLMHSLSFIISTLEATVYLVSVSGTITAQIQATNRRLVRMMLAWVIFSCIGMRLSLFDIIRSSCLTENTSMPKLHTAPRYRSCRTLIIKQLVPNLPQQKSCSCLLATLNGSFVCPLC